MIFLLYFDVYFIGKQPWRINQDMHEIITMAWEHKLTIAELPTQENFPLPKREDHVPIKKQLTESIIETTPNISTTNKNITIEVVNEKVPKPIDHEKVYQEILTRVKVKNAELHSLRCDFKLKLFVAEKFKDDVIYFPWNLDFRGRAYPIPPNLSHLGSDLCRGLLYFDCAKPLGVTGFFWLKVHLANLYGNNKISLPEREAWVHENMENVIDCVKNPLYGSLWWSKADEPFHALAACIEIVKAIESGDPTTYHSRLAVHQDGSCNGLQHYAALGRDALG